MRKPCHLLCKLVCTDNVSVPFSIPEDFAAACMLGDIARLSRLWLKHSPLLTAAHLTPVLVAMAKNALNVILNVAILPSKGKIE